MPATPAVPGTHLTAVNSPNNQLLSRWSSGKKSRVPGTAKLHIWFQQPLYRLWHLDAAEEPTLVKHYPCHSLYLVHEKGECNHVWTSTYHVVAVYLSSPCPLRCVVLLPCPVHGLACHPLLPACSTRWGHLELWPATAKHVLPCSSHSQVVAQSHLLLVAISLHCRCLCLCSCWWC
jgi:hypothetical protein